MPEPENVTAPFWRGMTIIFAGGALTTLLFVCFVEKRVASPSSIKSETDIQISGRRAAEHGLPANANPYVGFHNYGLVWLHAYMDEKERQQKAGK